MTDNSDNTIDEWIDYTQTSAILKSDFYESMESRLSVIEDISLHNIERTLSLIKEKQDTINEKIQYMDSDLDESISRLEGLSNEMNKEIESLDEKVDDLTQSLNEVFGKLRNYDDCIAFIFNQRKNMEESIKTSIYSKITLMFFFFTTAQLFLIKSMM